jgi:signal transduction histidine kinase
MISKEKGAEIIRAALNGEKQVFELTHCRLDGSVFEAEVSLNRVTFGGEVYVQAIVHDITELKHTEKQLQQYAAKLQAVNEELSQFAYVVSHDLKAPLRAIHNYADFLCEDLEGRLDDEQSLYLDGLKRAVKEADELIKDLLELSRIERQKIATETIEMGSFLRALIISLNLSREVEIVMPDVWPTLEVEPVLLKQIFQNLISNAVKFNTSSQKRIELGWQPLDDTHDKFFVHDNGIGISQDHLESIFRIFERLHTKEEFEGTGIGLAIVKKAVEKLGGAIWVESIPGEGSRFFIVLPHIQKQEEI